MCCEFFKLLLSAVHIQVDHTLTLCFLFGLCYSVYLWLSHQLNLDATLLSESADRCGFSKALQAIRQIWADKYGRHDPATERFAMVSISCIIQIFSQGEYLTLLTFPYTKFFVHVILLISP